MFRHIWQSSVRSKYKRTPELINIHTNYLKHIFTQNTYDFKNNISQ